MNIFYVHEDTKTCAQQHVDKHVVKMILEYAQLLSTAHRVLDGQETEGLSPTGRRQKIWKLPDERDASLYKATHMNHPSAKWARHSIHNYEWLFKLWIELQREYNYRYGKIHSCARLMRFLKNAPNNISRTETFSAPWRAMPDEFKESRDVEDYTVKSYRNYYTGAKMNMFKWKNRPVPDWIITK
jgi:hypothetical protein